MKRLPVVYSDDARRDLDFIFVALFEMSASAATAERYLNQIEERCRTIGDLPYGGAPRESIVPGLRIVPFKKRAVIAYVVTDEAVVITNVFYAGEDYIAILRGERPERWRPK